MKPYTHHQTITQLFEKAVSIYPENIAIYLNTGNITYRQFNEDVNQFAHYLRAKGVTRNVIVAIEMHRSYEMLCAIFAVMKAGGTYLPISPDYPEKRKKQMLEDADAKFLIVDSNDSCHTKNLIEILKLSDETIRSYSKQNLSPINDPEDMAYVIYTSGSTGKPKGVMIAHHSLVNRIEWMQDQFPIGSSDVLFQKTHCGFDVSIWEIFWWSISGAGVTLLPHGKEDNVILMSKIILENKVTVAHFVPTVFKLFLAYLEIGNKAAKLNSLRFIFASGEALDAKTVNQFNKLFHSSDYPLLINLYGPTEATIDVSYFICNKKISYQTIPIGKPIHNVQLMVLDDFLQPQPPEQIGELYIAGVCLAKGYLNNPEQMQRCFLQLPNDPKNTVYKTGDLVKWDSHGELCYIGRKDQQVKINGIRIELGEIEHHLDANHLIAHSIVLDIALNDFIKRLIAFIKLKNKSVPIEPADLKSFLQERLPDYMVPHDYVFIDEYPFKENGKLDREKLKTIYQNRKPG